MARCAAEVERRDTYRVARGTKSGFRMHYTKGQCRRMAVEGSDLCAQHKRQEEEGLPKRNSLWRVPAGRRLLTT